LSRWLRDYLYIPLGGSRYSRLLTYRNLFLTMLLGGLWHGAAWTFVIWGAFHGGLLAWQRWRDEIRGGPAPALATPLGRAVARFTTFHLVCLGWVLFRSNSLAEAGELLGRLVEPGAAPAVTPVVLVLVAGGIAVQYVPGDLRLRFQVGASRLRPVATALALGLFLLALDGFGPEGVAPFIYFQF